jgi:hypothetical protein
MTTWLTCGVALLAMVTSALNSETPESSPHSSAADLVLPLSGFPLSVDQIEERTHLLDSGSSVFEVIRSKVYRDSLGKLRIDSETQRDSDQSRTFIETIIDPSTGVKVVMLRDMRVAYRILGPKAGESGFAVGLSGIGEGVPSSRDWKTTKENLGKRTIEGVDFEGTRIRQAADSGLTNTIEKWYCDKLSLTGLAVASGPYGTHTARIENLRLEEPDPTIFAIPNGYTVLDLPIGDVR